MSSAPEINLWRGNFFTEHSSESTHYPVEQELFPIPATGMVIIRRGSRSIHKPQAIAKLRKHFHYATGSRVEIHKESRRGLLYGTPWTCYFRLAGAARLKIQTPFLRITSSKVNLLGYTPRHGDIGFRVFWNSTSQ